MAHKGTFSAYKKVTPITEDFGGHAINFVERLNRYDNAKAKAAASAIKKTREDLEKYYDKFKPLELGKEVESSFREKGRKLLDDVSEEYFNTYMAMGKLNKAGLRSSPEYQRLSQRYNKMKDMPIIIAQMQGRAKAYQQEITKGLKEGSVYISPEDLTKMNDGWSPENWDFEFNKEDGGLSFVYRNGDKWEKQDTSGGFNNSTFFGIRAAKNTRVYNFTGEDGKDGFIDKGIKEVLFDVTKSQKIDGDKKITTEVGSALIDKRANLLREDIDDVQRLSFLRMLGLGNADFNEEGTGVHMNGMSFKKDREGIIAEDSYEDDFLSNDEIDDAIIDFFKEKAEAKLKPSYRQETVTTAGKLSKVEEVEPDMSFSPTTNSGILSNQDGYIASFPRSYEVSLLTDSEKNDSDKNNVNSGAVLINESFNPSVDNGVIFENAFGEEIKLSNEYPRGVAKKADENISNVGMIGVKVVPMTTSQSKYYITATGEKEGEDNKDISIPIAAGNARILFGGDIPKNVKITDKGGHEVNSKVRQQVIDDIEKNTKDHILIPLKAKQDVSVDVSYNTSLATLKAASEPIKKRINLLLDKYKDDSGAYDKKAIQKDYFIEDDVLDYLTKGKYSKGDTKKSSNSYISYEPYNKLSDEDKRLYEALAKRAKKEKNLSELNDAQKKWVLDNYKRIK